MLNDVVISGIPVSAPGFVQTLSAEQTGNGALKPVTGLQFVAAEGAGEDGTVSPLPPHPARSTTGRIHIRFTMAAMVFPHETILHAVILGVADDSDQCKASWRSMTIVTALTYGVYGRLPVPRAAKRIIRRLVTSVTTKRDALHWWQCPAMGML
jgi:hypothetical protein